MSVTLVLLILAWSTNELGHSVDVVTSRSASQCHWQCQWMKRKTGVEAENKDFEFFNLFSWVSKGVETNQCYPHISGLSMLPQS